MRAASVPLFVVPKLGTTNSSHISGRSCPNYNDIVGLSHTLPLLVKVDQRLLLTFAARLLLDYRYWPRYRDFLIWLSGGRSDLEQ